MNTERKINPQLQTASTSSVIVHHSSAIPPVELPVCSANRAGKRTTMQYSRKVFCLLWGFSGTINLKSWSLIPTENWHQQMQKKTLFCMSLVIYVSLTLRCSSPTATVTTSGESKAFRVFFYCTSRFFSLALKMAWIQKVYQIIKYKGKVIQHTD